MELKRLSVLLLCGSVSRSNRTFMELKLTNGSYSGNSITRSNRTFMELKRR